MSLRFLSDKADPPFWIGGRAAPDPKNLLCCRNGVLDITTRRFYPPAPDLFALDSRGFDYDATAPKPKEWLAFLTSLWPNDQESSDTLATIFGYVLTSATKMQKMFLIIGPARSGKGTISRVLKSIVGSENVAEPALQQLASESDFALQQLIGKRLAIVGDARVSSKADPQAAVERMLKISGEDGMTIGRKYKDDWRGRLGTRFLILANELPDLKDDSGAFAERFILLRLSKSFLGIEDHNLEERLMKERAGILNWALDGLDALRKAKRFKQPDASQGAIDDLKALGSPVRAFIEDRCVTGPLFENGEARAVGKADLFAAYRSWCAASERKAMTEEVFAKRLRAAVPGLDTDRPQPGKKGEKRVRRYTGISLAGDQRDGPSGPSGPGGPSDS